MPGIGECWKNDSAYCYPPLPHTHCLLRDPGHSVSTWAPQRQTVTRSLTRVRSSVRKAKLGTVGSTHLAEPWLLATSSSLSSLMVSLVISQISQRGGPLPELTLPTWQSVCSSFNSPPWSPGGQLASQSWPSSKTSSPTLIPAQRAARPWPISCSGSSWEGLAAIIIYQKLKSHKRTQTTPCHPLALSSAPTSPKRWA